MLHYLVAPFRSTSLFVLYLPLYLIIFFSDGPSSLTLREVQIPVVTQESCKESYKNFKTVVVDQSVLCAGLGKGGKDACQV